MAGYTVHTDDGGLVVDDHRAVEAPDDVAVALMKAGLPPTRLTADGEDLESYFLRAVGVHDA
jgi:ABC-2 type transport system ATP-binding protein